VEAAEAKQGRRNGLFVAVRSPGKRTMGGSVWRRDGAPKRGGVGPREGQGGRVASHGGEAKPVGGETTAAAAYQAPAGLEVEEG